MIRFETLNKYTSNGKESSVAKYLSMINSLILAEIAPLKQVFRFSISSLMNQEVCQNFI